MRSQVKSKFTPAGDRIAGTMADGVVILVPKVKPTNVTIDQMRTVFRGIKRESDSDVYIEKPAQKPFRK
jgi:hypothetical protein